MAPQREHFVSTVYSTQVRSNDEKSILVEAGGFTPTRWFLEHGARPQKNEEEDDDEPPRKKRKVQETDEAPALAPMANARTSPISLFEVAIDFHFPESVKSKSAPEAAIMSDVDFQGMPSLPVAPYGIETDYAGTRMRIGMPLQGKSPVLIIECGTISEDVLELLRRIALPGQLRSTNARKKDHPASQLSCTLTRSVGPTYTVIRLKASLRWCSGISAFPAGAPVGSARVYPDYETLLQAYPDADREGFDHSQPFTPQDFYESVHAPSKQLHLSEDLYRDVLESDLYPFQKRAVSWMLQRESVGPSRDASPFTDAGGDLEEQISAAPDTRFYQRVADADGKECWVNHLQGIITRSPPQDTRLSGGLLAEEMGLGKTVELMALIAINKRPRMSPGKVYDRSSGTKVAPSRATLIVTPNSLTQQWKSELKRHAPDLRVFHYEGIPSKKGASESTIIRELCEDYDVVLATYQVLAREIHYAEDPPDRNMRHARKFERKRSPLIQIEWWRLCLDEAQMVESGVTAAARVACRLPRVHSWAVSGTPLRKDVQDLLGLLIFLRYQPFAENSRLWSHLITNHRHHFRKIFGEIALRHTKALIRDELQLPPQKRAVITVPFSVVEQQNYAELFDQMCEEIGLNKSGEPTRDDWNPDDAAEAMRMWLVRLRQTCLHPQVGTKNRKALGRGTNPLRTVSEVLEVMIEQNETNLRTEERLLAAASLRRGHILGNSGENNSRSRSAVEVYEKVLSDSETMVMEARARLAAAKTADPDDGATSDTAEERDSATESTPLIGRLKSNLRSALQLQHQCAFFAATSHYQIKTNESLVQPESDEFKQLEGKENMLYETAKVARKELMKDTFRKAETLMKDVRALEKGGGKYTKLPKIKDLPSTGGIESRRIVEKADELFDVIREQVVVLKDWRAKMTSFLVQQLVDSDNGLAEVTGDEYEESTKQQDELYVYFDAFKAVQADLNSFITGEDAPLIDVEVKSMIKAAKTVLNPDIVEEEKPEGIHSPQLALDLYAIRNRLRARRNQVGSVRALIQEARSLEVSTQFSNGSRVAAEGALIQEHIVALQAIFTAYTKALSGLEKELELFRTTQNQRVEFYRHLQELSDDVAPYREELDVELDQHSLGLAIHKEEQSTKKLQQLQVKNRFLLNLREDNTESGPRTCIICIAPFERGVLTVCGHQFCKECLSQWLSQSKSCPTCKRKLSTYDLHDITFKPQQLRVQEESAEASSQSPGVARLAQSIYNDVDSTLMSEIKTIDLPTSYGTKIDTLGRHLHWIRSNDPGAKSVIFSQYREFLDVLGGALRDFKIGFSRLGRSGAVEKFRNDASIDCLLLDAKTDSSGLTLVNATHVFICEPLIQTAVELQAIARVHRIGQKRPTTVWMYLVSDTVEEAIYETSVARRLAHVQSRQQKQHEKNRSRSATPAPLQENAIDAANSEELQSAPLTKLLVAGKSGGEVVAKDDLWQCLFGKVQKPQTSPAARQDINRHLRAEAAETRAGAEASETGVSESAQF